MILLFPVFTDSGVGVGGGGGEVRHSNRFKYICPEHSLSGSTE